MKKITVFLFIAVLLVFMACPAYATAGEAVVTGTVADPMLEFFPSVFESIISIFECKPMLYLFSIFILAFIVLIFRTITKH